MKMIDLKVNKPKDEVLELIGNSKSVNENVKFDEKAGTPLIHLTEKEGKVKITCEMINRPVKDNGFIVGTYFKGKITEQDGETHLKGVIVTAPIYHIVWFILLAVMIWQCFYHAAISVLPILFVAFEFMMFFGEFKKQGYIERYLHRAFKRLSAKKQ